MEKNGAFEYFRLLFSQLDRKKQWRWQKVFWEYFEEIELKENIQGILGYFTELYYKYIYTINKNFRMERTGFIIPSAPFASGGIRR